jgi:hypothetical protein
VRATKKLSELQRHWLLGIGSAGEAGISEATLLSLTGKAKKYAGKYAFSLKTAIDAHNEGRTINSPLPLGTHVESGAFGPRGGYGHRIVTDATIQVAKQVLSTLEGQKP